MPRPFARAICWLRRDLRLSDHAALAAATAESEGVVVAFVFDPRILDELPDRDDRRMTFIYRSLEEVDRELRKAGSTLAICYGDPLLEMPSLAKRLQIDAVFTARDDEPYAVDRDARVGCALESLGIAFRAVKDSVVFEGGEVLTQSGTPFRVYSPYARAWRSRFEAHRDAAEHVPDLTRLFPAHEIDQSLSEDQLRIKPGERPQLGNLSLESLGFTRSELWLPPGEAAALARLSAFVEKLSLYPSVRNLPAEDGTSGLSVHLRFGTVSIRECVRRAVAAGSDGEAWLRELIWRDFFRDVLHHHPHVAERPFQSRYDAIEYPGLDGHFEAWCEGMTGYPMVDAAMRCLNATGWMHNRLRMIVASFLTKDLLIDYRRGETYFARKLLDFDLASNNGNWQWAASTGCDAQPYFRIFNPITQSTKFDPDGTFIRQWVPELSTLVAPAIHFPASASSMELEAANVTLGVNYPFPVVDHAHQRDRAIALLSYV